MKTALDIPDDLFREIKVEAALRGRKLKDLVSEFLRVGLAASRQAPTAVARIEKNPITGLPVIVGGHPATPELEMTPERVAEILSQEPTE